MIPADFPEANSTFGPPKDLEVSQCGAVRAFCGQIRGGDCDGMDVVVTAWAPSKEEIEDIKAGRPIYFICFGGLPPHFLSTTFASAIGPG